MAKPIIYISSTFFDLEEHRKALMQALSKTQCFDVLGMEYYGTQGQRPLDVCLGDVEKAEFYILLLGGRYGFIPKDQPAYIPKDRPLSITNLEYKKAISDGGPEVAGDPDYVKCVLPFLIDPNNFQSETVTRKIKEEEERDGPDLQARKKDLLQQLKKKVGEDFTLDSPFTSPADLVAKVMSSLIPELVKRNYASLVDKLKIPYEIVYRCNRESTRKEFLYENFHHKNFYRAFVIHGKDEEKPKYFSNNLEYYDLNSRLDAMVCNMDDYSDYGPERFLIMLARDIHLYVFEEEPESRTLSFAALGQKIVEWAAFKPKVIKFDISYGAWKLQYEDMFVPFFNALAQANKQLQTPKNFYILMNIIYTKAEEKIEQQHEAFVLLNRLGSIKTSHIEQWVRSYFIRVDKRRLLPNQVEDIATEITEYYFPAYVRSGEGFSMRVAKETLDNIVSDFNDNKNLFTDYSKLFTK